MMKKLKIVFFGSGEIAIASLKMLLVTGYDVCYVVTAPDKAKGRHLKDSFTPIKVFSLEEGLNIFQPDKFNIDVCDFIKKLEPDLFVVFSYGKILPKTLLSIPKLFALNIHTSLLPRYRGAAPINWVIINGGEETGVSLIRMNEKMDEGDIILKEKVKITEEDNSISLENKLSEHAVKLLKETLAIIENDTIKFKRQSENATYAPKLKKEDGRILWNKTARDINNQIRGCQPWPGSFTSLEDKIIKIWKAEPIDLKDSENVGEIINIDKDGILVATGKGGLLIKELQLASGKRLSASQFIAGHRLHPGMKFD